MSVGQALRWEQALQFWSVGHTPKSVQPRVRSSSCVKTTTVVQWLRSGDAEISGAAPGGGGR